jgi:hypothetical protein
VTQPVDSSILHEIVRVVESRRKVPERIQVRAREYLITYLEDHQRRLQEALQRYDSDRLNMLYGQLASKVKYQLLRRLPATTTRNQAKEKPKASPKSKSAPRAKAKPKPKPKAKTKTSKKSRPAGKSPKASPARGKRRAAGRSIAARKPKPSPSGKRGSKRKPPKK